MSDLIQAEFTISETARKVLAELKIFMTEELPPDDPPQVLMVSWGLFYDNNHVEHGAGSVVVSYYTRSEVNGVRDLIQVVDGLPLVFFTTPTYARKFTGKVVDFEKSRGFFLRD